ncbi:hypothetical protein [Streptomyces platensis]|uniref:hypothetical protein n=1 Tax=Streptomyces platensis TaxID=58346 RepID=UPI00386E57C7|nr:hypothetical protein OG962_06950 [Streptomyces platensis]
MLVTVKFDAGGAGETAADLRPLQSSQGTVLGMEQDVDVEDGVPIALGTGGEDVLQQRVAEGPLDKPALPEHLRLSSAGS